MSINRNAVLAYGWPVTTDDFASMNEKTNYKYERHFICVDAWSADGGYVLGTQLLSLEEGCSLPIDINELISIRDNFMLNPWKKIMDDCGKPDLVWHEPQLIIIHQVT